MWSTRSVASMNDVDAYEGRHIMGCEEASDGVHVECHFVVIFGGRQHSVRGQVAWANNSPDR